MSKFDTFVVFAEMRTGSNFLEANLNALDGIVCHGEAFNPHFIGYPNTSQILGVSQDMRDAEPETLIRVIRDQVDVLGGFRYFNDHDPRVLDGLLADPRCAKIILTRNPVESYVSRKIAAATGQWKLTNVKHARTEQIRFEAAEFESHLERLQDFQIKLLRALQVSGQSAFYVDYEDIQDVEVMNGLAAWLGVEGRLEALDKKLKKQNPADLEAKVMNYEAMRDALARMDRFQLGRTPNFEPRRGAAIPTYLAAADAPLLYMPIRSGPEAAVSAWFADLSGGAAPLTGFNQKTIRSWRQDRPGHRSFTVLRHPLARAHAAFCDKILPVGPGAFVEMRQTLRRTFDLPLPEGEVGEGYDTAAHRAAFEVWLRFLKANLSGQTNLRMDPAWTSQANILQGMAGIAPPDHLIREEEMGAALPALASAVGVSTPPALQDVTDPHAEALAMIYDPTLEKLSRDVYGRDYELFGFADWAR